MRALLSSVGTRGDVQPVVALALEVRALGHVARLCVPPNFVAWVRGLGFEAFSVGVEMRHTPGAPKPIPDLVRDQFDAVGAAAEGCDVILGANAHQYAARSIAELRGVPYVTALYAPVQDWAASSRAWNERALERVNQNRARLGLAAIDDAFRYNVTDHAWLAADAALAPSPPDVFQTGAWVLGDAAPLPRELEAFLDAGPPPVYAGFGSMPVREGVARAVVDAARAVSRRLILSRGWADLQLMEGASDCIAVGDVSHQALFPRVAVAVHHGGAGTTAAAARAGVPQVVAPMFSDQFYWASRVRALGLGASAQPLSTEALAAALREALDPAVAARARSFTSELRADGARVAALALSDR